MVILLLGHRSRTDVMTQILEAADGGVGGRDGDHSTIMQIMAKVYLDYDQLRGYLDILTGSGLLNYDREMQTFNTTEQGLEFLRAYNQIDQILAKHQI